MVGDQEYPFEKKGCRSNTNRTTLGRQQHFSIDVFKASLVIFTLKYWKHAVERTTLTNEYRSGLGTSKSPYLLEYLTIWVCRTGSINNTIEINCSLVRLPVQSYFFLPPWIFL